MATVYKRRWGTSWSYMLSYYDHSGHRRYVTLGKISKTLANQIKKKVETDLLTHQYNALLGVKNARMTLEQLQELVLQRKQNEVRRETYKLYEEALANFLDFVEVSKVTEVTKEIVLAWRDSQIAKGLSKTTINKWHRHLKHAFELAITDFQVSGENPFRIVKQFREEEKAPPTMPADHIIALFNTFNETKVNEFKDKVYYHLLYRIGCRTGEAMQLTWNDIYLESDIPYLVFRSKTTKGHKENSIPLPPELVADLKSLPHTSERPFDQMKGKWSPANRFKKYLTRANLPSHYTPYYLRHTFATENPATIQEISALYNHSSIKVTEKYMHLRELKRKKQIVDAYPALTALNQSKPEEQNGSAEKASDS